MTETSPLQWVLAGLTEPFDGREFLLLSGEIRIGRVEGNDIVLPDNNISRHHATLISNGGKLYLGDAGSKNGVIVNGVRQSKCELHMGDELQIGPLRFRVGVDGDMVDPPSPLPAAASASIPESHNPFSAMASRWPELGNALGRVGFKRILLYGSALSVLAFLFTSGAEVALAPKPAAQEKAALSFFVKPVTVPAGTTDEMVQSWVAQADQALRYDDNARAIDLLRTVVAARPGNERARAKLERAQSRLGQLLQIYYEEGAREYEKLYYDRAIRQWQKVVSLAGSLDPDTARMATEKIQEAQARLSARK